MNELCLKYKLHISPIVALHFLMVTTSEEMDTNNSCSQKNTAIKHFQVKATESIDASTLPGVELLHRAALDHLYQHHRAA